MAIPMGKIVELAEAKYPPLKREDCLCTDRAFEEMDQFRTGQRVGFIAGMVYVLEEVKVGVER